MRSLSLALVLLVAACTSSSDPLDVADDGAFDIGKGDGMQCLASEASDDARGLLAYANDPAVDAAELDALGLYGDAAAGIVAARPFATLAALDAVPHVGPVACRRLRDQACNVRGLCEPELAVWTWNVKMFPLGNDTVGHVAASLADAELVAFQEVDSLPAFDELIGVMPGWGGVPGRTGFGTQVAIAFRTDRLELVATEDLWPNDPDRFPRPVLAATFELAGRVGRARITVLDVHLKAQIDSDSQRRRRDAIVVLEQWLAARRASGDRVIVLGDWNDSIDDAPADNVFAPLLARPDAYAALTADVAARGQYSYVPFKTLIDHVVMTREAVDTLALRDVDPVPLEQTIADYTHAVSDHRPVRARLVPVLPR